MLRGYEKLPKATKDGDKEVQDLLKILEKSIKSIKRNHNANKTRRWNKRIRKTAKKRYSKNLTNLIELQLRRK